MIIALFCTSKRFGWGFDNLMAEANKGKGLKIKPWMKPIFGVVVPVCILAIYIIGMVTFEWSPRGGTRTPKIIVLRDYVVLRIAV